MVPERCWHVRGRGARAARDVIPRAVLHVEKPRHSDYENRALLSSV